MLIFCKKFNQNMLWTRKFYKMAYMNGENPQPLSGLKCFYNYYFFLFFCRENMAWHMVKLYFLWKVIMIFFFSGYFKGLQSFLAAYMIPGHYIKDRELTGWVHRLIWIFTIWIWHNVGFSSPWHDLVLFSHWRVIIIILLFCYYVFIPRWLVTCITGF